jgi:hypothetical protein
VSALPPDEPQDSESERLRRALKETVLNLQRLAEEVERALRRGEERLAEFKIDDE